MTPILLMFRYYEKAKTFLAFFHSFLASNYKWKMGQIFVAFAEYLNFTVPNCCHLPVQFW